MASFFTIWLNDSYMMKYRRSSRMKSFSTAVFQDEILGVPIMKTKVVPKATNTICWSVNIDYCTDNLNHAATYSIIILILGLILQKKSNWETLD